MNLGKKVGVEFLRPYVATVRSLRLFQDGNSLDRLVQGRSPSRSVCFKRSLWLLCRNQTLAVKMPRHEDQSPDTACRGLAPFFLYPFSSESSQRLFFSLHHSPPPGLVNAYSSLVRISASVVMSEKFSFSHTHPPVTSSQISPSPL